MPSIFLSHTRDDDKPFVRRLRDDLVACVFDVWFDRIDIPSRSLQGSPDVPWSEP
jgi:hypothetical protein